jgi:molybdopterin-containing oxidoreductase family iron-sulfur binding subunit
MPTALPLESWDEYGGTSDVVATLQPAMGRISEAPPIGEVFLKAAFKKTAPEDSYKRYVIAGLLTGGAVRSESDWLKTLQRGGVFDTGATSRPAEKGDFDPSDGRRLLASLSDPPDGLTFVPAPSLRFFDGRGANRPWLCEIPDPLTRVAWQAPVLLNPKAVQNLGLKQGDLVQVSNGDARLEAPVFSMPGVHPQAAVMTVGQGHTAFGRYAAGRGGNPFALLTAAADGRTGVPHLYADGIQITATARSLKLANTDGERTQHGRKIAVSVTMASLPALAQRKKVGLTMWDFPLTLPLAEGYDPKRDFYEPHVHDGYRWGMVVDLDRCIGCGACAAACYAENNVGIVGEERVLEGREMAWLSVERYVEEANPERITFLPLMCQHCDNAPCESVCPVYAPHHNKEGMNNQIYNRCIGTRYCSQNCPYKVRRFNWYSWEWPEPLPMQLNPNVTVRSKGVMEKCSFCVQRIKDAHNWAKNENRSIRDGEIVPACVQTCPTDALVFGSLMDPASRVRQMVEDPRAYQIMGYLNTKPGVVYLKKVVQEV